MPDDAAARQRSGFAIVLRVALAILVSTALVVTLLRLGGRAAVDVVLHPARPALVFLALPAYLLGYAFRILRFRALAGPCSLRRLTGVVFVHNALNRILPLKVGELSYPVFAARNGIATPSLATLDLLTARLLDLCALLLAFLLIPLYAPDFSLPPLSLVVAAILLLFALLLLLGLRRTSVALLGLLRWLSARLPLLGRRLREKLDALSSAAKEEIAMRGPPPWLAVVLWTVAIWIFLILTSGLVVRGFDPSVSTDQIVAGMTGGSLAGALPVGGVGTIGVLETGWVLVATAAGIERSAAIATGLAFQAVTLLYSAAIGLFGFAVLLRRGRPGDGAG